MSCCCHEEKENKPQASCCSKEVKSCCGEHKKEANKVPSCCSSEHNHSVDLVSLISLIICIGAYLTPLLPFKLDKLTTFSSSITELMAQMWWGVAFGIIFTGLMSYVPKSVIGKLLGTKKGLKGILKATFAGVVLDMCNHGILMIAAKLYQKGARLGQVMAFLIASPWNSLSLTIIMASLIGLKWTITFIILSMIVAVISGLIFDNLVEKGVLGNNPNTEDFDENISIIAVLVDTAKEHKPSFKGLIGFLINSTKESTMIVRWLLIGAIIAAVIRTFVPSDIYHEYLGASLLGLFVTLVFATVIEVCSEGSIPIASDLLTRAGAVGNAFTFLMTGVATDYTEMMIIREATKSWKIALFIPLVCVPQVLIIGYILNIIGAS